MKKSKFITEFDDIPKPRQKMLHLSLEERKGNFKEVELGFTEELALAEARRCLSCRRCIGCGLCLAECDQQAIVYDQTEETIKLNVGAVILTPGFDEFDANRKKELGYGKFLNVVNSIEFERILSPTGPYGGVVMRPYDGQIPGKIAFIQCVGSRDEGIGANYCSNICCMSTLKEAIAAKDKIERLEVKVFYKDIRPLAKASETYYLKAKQEGVQFVRADVSQITEKGETGNLQIEYSENGEVKTEEFDLVVLAVGLSAPRDAKSLARKARVQLNKYSFCAGDSLSPVTTAKEGIFAAGAFAGPKDVSETITQASAVAAKINAMLPSNSRPVSQEENTSSQPKRTGSKIGVFFCRYGLETQANVDVDDLIHYTQSLSDEIYIDENEYSCVVFSKNKIIEAVEKENIGKVVIVPCYSDTHRSLFEEVVKQAGLGMESLEIVDFQSGNGEVTTEDAKRILQETIARFSTSRSVPEKTERVIPRGLVIGGGISGLTAALDMAEQGIEVYLIEKEAKLGGQLQKAQFGNEKASEYLQSLLGKIEANEKIHVYQNTQITKVEGNSGDFKVMYSTNGGMNSVDVGAIIVATGGREYQPSEYFYGKDPRVLTQIELEEKLAEGQFSEKNVVMVQCVGSRNEQRPYCSQVCCGQAIKNALKLKELNPETQIHILHRDIRVYGFDEDFYTDAVEKGIKFIRMDTYPEVNATKDALVVSVMDRLTGEAIKLNADALVLSTAILPQEDNVALGQILGVSLDSDGFFKEADTKLRPVEFEKQGVFLCGLAHGPRSLEACISQASAVASKACLLLKQADLRGKTTD